MITALPLMRNVLTTLAKSILIPSGLTAAASATHADEKWSEREKLLG